MVKKPACQCRRHKRFGFNLVGKIPWRRAWQLIPLSLPGESLGQRSLVGLQSMGSQRVIHDPRDFNKHKACKKINITLVRFYFKLV